MTSTEVPSLEEFTAAARTWLDANAERRGQREEPDEIQRNTVAERVLGLPREPRPI